ncbi:MAG: diheme cytochrome c [Magnetococcales bacterium]|nr:diheme cytochrome c [Magnetococcales bacterium]
MNKMQKRVGIGLLVLSLGGGLVLGVSASDREKNEGKPRADVAPVQNTLYSTECGACHFAYQPGLLPARSWEKLLTGLGEHFGENAEVSPATLTALREYLTGNAADRVDHGRSRKINASILDGEKPIRVTETGYFQKEHRELSPHMREKNSKIGSLSRCEACHTQAAQGSFHEHEVRMPGEGR